MSGAAHAKSVGERFFDIAMQVAAKCFVIHIAHDLNAVFGAERGSSHCCGCLSLEEWYRRVAQLSLSNSVIIRSSYLNHPTRGRGRKKRRSGNDVALTISHARSPRTESLN